MIVVSSSQAIQGVVLLAHLLSLEYYPFPLLSPRAALRAHHHEVP